MAQPDDFIKFTLYKDEVQATKRNAIITYKQQLDGTITGYSHVYEGTPEQVEKRKKRLLWDGYTGQLGTLALNIYIFDPVKGLIMYQKSRDIANANPTKGDKGCDIIGYQMDIKTSSMLFHRNMMNFHLLVRPKERHIGNVYLHGLIKDTGYQLIKVNGDYNSPYNERREDMVIVHITGWAYETDLPDYTQYINRDIDNVYALEVKDLRPMSTYHEAKKYLNFKG